MFADGSFDTLQSGLHKGGLLTLGSGVTISTENVIFLFITDAGADRFQELIISYGDRSEIPQSVIRSAARNALVDHMGIDQESNSIHADGEIPNTGSF